MEATTSTAGEGCDSCHHHDPSDGQQHSSSSPDAPVAPPLPFSVSHDESPNRRRRGDKNASSSHRYGTFYGEGGLGGWLPPPLIDSTGYWDGDDDDDDDLLGKHG